MLWSMMGLETGRYTKGHGWYCNIVGFFLAVCFVLFREDIAAHVVTKTARGKPSYPSPHTFPYIHHYLSACREQGPLQRYLH